MTDAVALNSNQITTLGVGAIIALVVIGFLLSMVITAVVGRIVILVAVVALGAVIWQQRTEIKHRVDECRLDMTFLGVHVQAPKDVVKACQDRPTSLGR